MAGAALTQTALNLARPVTSYRLLALDAPEAAVGWATAAYALLPLLGALWMGRATDRLPSAVPLVAAGALTMGAGGAGLALATSAPAVYATSAVLGVGHLAFTIAGQAAIARRAGPGLLDAGFGWFTAAFSVGQMAGPLLAGPLLADGATVEATGLALWVSAGIAAAGILPVLLVPGARPRPGERGGAVEPGAGPGDAAETAHASAPRGGETADAAAPPGEATTPEPAAGRHGGRPSLARILRVPGVAPQLLASVALLAMVDILSAFLPVVGEHYGVSPAHVGVLLAVRGAGSLLSRALLPLLRRRWSREGLVRTALLFSAAAIGVAPLGLAEPAWGWVAVVAMAAGGFTLGLGQPLTMSLVTQAVPAGWRSSALAVRLMGNRAGQVVLPATAGLLAAPLGPAAAVWFACAVLAASGLERTAAARRRR
ncbi:MFS transporter [Micrococcus endophyticus]|uniref:MFS transporter n=1 Tax=Micrococcus endophyticus TaxID=455343 RepID=UPI0034CE70A1